METTRTTSEEILGSSGKASKGSDPRTAFSGRYPHNQLNYEGAGSFKYFTAGHFFVLELPDYVAGVSFTYTLTTTGRVALSR